MSCTPRFCILVAVICVTVHAYGEPPKEEFHSADDARQSLQQLQTLVGQWRGVGQLRRGSAKGAWREEGEWAWKFDKDSPSIQFLTDEGAKYIHHMQLVPESGAASYRLVAQGPDDASAQYRAERDDEERLVAVRLKGDVSLPARITMRTVAGGDRLLVLLEQQSPISKRYVRLAEIGYTRKGSGFGQGTTFVECIVTGGKGTIPVTYQTQTYYVCCTGCRDYFNEDPERALAEYQAAQNQP